MSSTITRSKSKNHVNQLQIDSSSINDCGVFNIIETSYDGDCLYSSIADFFERNEHLFNDTPRLAHQIRSNTVDYILSRNSSGFQLNWERFVESIIFNLETRITGLTQYGNNVKKDESIRQSYRKYMKQSGNFGTFSELCAAAEYYGFSGYIFQRDDSNVICCYDYGFTGTPDIDLTKPQLLLLFTGPIDAGHFRRLEPSIAPSIIHPGKYQITNSSLALASQGSKVTISQLHGNPSTNSQIPKTIASQPKPISCEICKQQFKSISGLEVHRTQHDHVPKKKSNKKSNKNAKESGSEPVSEPLSGPVSEPITCDICKQTFETAKGLAVHRNRHTKEANNTTANNLQSRLKVSPSDTHSANDVNTEGSSKSTLDSECNKWRKIFEEFENNDTLDEAAFDSNVENFQKFLFTATQRLPGPQHPSTKYYRLRQQKKEPKKYFSPTIEVIESSEDRHQCKTASA